MPWHSTSWIEKHQEVLAQEVHISLGVLLPLAADCSTTLQSSVAAAILILAAIKELTFDLIVEKDTVLGGLYDLLAYGVGVVIAFGLLYIYHISTGPSSFP